jgi:hypothetical protein
VIHRRLKAQYSSFLQLLEPIGTYGHLRPLSIVAALAKTALELPEMLAAANLLKDTAW